MQHLEDDFGINRSHLLLCIGSGKGRDFFVNFYLFVSLFYIKWMEHKRKKIPRGEINLQNR